MDFPIDLTNVEIRTKRLLLRAFRPSDLDDLFEYAKVPGVGEMAGWPHHETKETSQFILRMFIEEKKTFAIVFDGKVIGSLGIETTNPNHFPELDDLKGKELGYALSKAYWGKGIMPEAASAALNYCFDVLKCDFVTCCSFNWNKQSASVQHKLGFNDYKTLVYRDRMDNLHESTGRIIYSKSIPMRERVYRYLRTIPQGKVATYGQIAEFLGNKNLARVVGNILHNNPNPDLNPCYKVVNSKGELAKKFGAPGGIDEQRRRLENDGINVINDKVDLRNCIYVAYK